MLRESLSKTFDLAFPDAKHQDAVHLCRFMSILLSVDPFRVYVVRAFCMLVDFCGYVRMLEEPKGPNMLTPLQVKFGDVAGCDGAKTELVEVVDFLKNASRPSASFGYHNY